MPKSGKPEIDDRMRIELYQDASLQWRWRGVDGNYRIICDGAEGYVSREAALRGIDNVMVEFRGPVVVVARQRRRYGTLTLDAPRATITHHERRQTEGVPPVYSEYEELAEYQPEGAK